VNVAFATLASTVAQKLYGVVKDASNVFLYVILQVIAPVNHAFILVIVVTIISCAVDNMCYPIVFKSFGIFGYEISAQVQEAVNNFRADTLVKLVFILFARGASIVKVFIVELLRCNLIVLNSV